MSAIYYGVTQRDGRSYLWCPKWLEAIGIKASPWLKLDDGEPRDAIRTLLFVLRAEAPPPEDVLVHVVPFHKHWDGDLDRAPTIDDLIPRPDWIGGRGASRKVRWEPPDDGEI